MQQSELASIMGHEHIESSYVYTRLWGTGIEDAYRRHHVDKQILDKNIRLKYTEAKIDVKKDNYAESFSIPKGHNRSQTENRVRLGKGQRGWRKTNELPRSRRLNRNEQTMGAKGGAKVFHREH